MHGPRKNTGENRRQADRFSFDKPCLFHRWHFHRSRDFLSRPVPESNDPEAEDQANCGINQKEEVLPRYLSVKTEYICTADVRFPRHSRTNECQGTIVMTGDDSLHNSCAGFHTIHLSCNA